MAFDPHIHPPKMEKKPYTTTVHGQELSDPYYWFRNRELPEVIDHLKAENEYTNKQLSKFDQLHKKLWKELKGRVKDSDESYPVKKGDYYYYSKDVEGHEYRIFCRKYKNLEANEEIILDLNQLAEGKDYLSLGDFKISSDNNTLAYSLDDNGSEEYTIYFKNLKENWLYNEIFFNTSPNFEWGNDNKSFYFLELDPNHRPNKVFKYELGLPVDSKTLVYEEKSPDYHVSINKAKTHSYLFINIFSHATSEILYLNLNLNPSIPQMILKREASIHYEVDDSGNNTFFVYTNKEATNFKIAEAPIGSDSEDEWKIIVEHNPDVYISDFEIFKDRIVLTERFNGINRLRDYNYKTHKSYIIEVPEENCELGSYENLNFYSETFYFTYSSLVTPLSILSYNFETHQVEFCKTKDIPGYDSSLYETKRHFFKSHDGELVPISLLYKKGFIPDGTAPCYLYGYGSYGLNIPPAFRSHIFSLVDRGFVYAIAHIRGSSTMGRHWYENGKLKNKTNSFYDFISAAEFLIEQRFTSKGEIVICGGSAGGMLVGTTANLRPDLFKAVIAHVPFVDCLNTMLDDTLPLTTIEYDEWGNPNDKDYFDYIKSYSTYDNVARQDYPHMFVTAGLNDPRVTYWEPAKWVAKLREYKTDSNFILLKTNMEAGHKGKTGRYESLKEYADEFTFILALFAND